MILHFVRPLVMSPRIRIPSHAFNPSKHATDSQSFDARGPKFTGNVCAILARLEKKRRFTTLGSHFVVPYIVGHEVIYFVCGNMV